MKHELSFSDFRFLDFSSLEFDEYSVFVSKLPLTSASIAEEANYRFLERELDRISWWTESLSMRTAHLEKGLWRYEAVLEFSGSSLYVAEVKFLRSLQARLFRRPLLQRDWLDYDTAIDVLMERVVLGWDSTPEEGRQKFIYKIGESYADYESWEGCRDIHFLSFGALQEINHKQHGWQKAGLAYCIIEKLKADVQNQDWNKHNV
jgi:hypothetical protein